MKKEFTYMKSTLVLALIAGFGGAQAGTLASATAGGTVFAVENFGATYGATNGIQPGAVTYTVSTTNGIVINAGGKIYFTVRLTGGTFKAASLAGQFTGSALDVGGVGNGGVGVPVLSSDGTTVMVPITYTASATLGVGSNLIYTPPGNASATAIVGVKAALATVGGKVSAAASLSAITPVAGVAPASTTTAPNTGTAQAADIDSPVATADIATSAQGITASVSALPTYTGKIDLTVTPAATDYALAATPGVALFAAKLGSVKFKDKTVNAAQLDGTTAFNVAAAQTASSTTIVVTPGAGQAFPIGAILSVSVANDQCNTRVGPLAAFTAATSTAAATLTVPVTTNDTPIEICLTKPAGAGSTASPITPTLAASLNNVAVAATTAPSAATGLGYALDYNGAKVDVKTYFPNALSVYGYGSYIRVTNTGIVPAVVSGAFITETTGVAGTSYPLTTTMPAGSSKVVTGAQIEAVLGAPGAADRPRLRLTAPTNGLQVQYFFQSPTGTINEISGGIN